MKVGRHEEKLCPLGLDRSMVSSSGEAHFWALPIENRPFAMGKNAKKTRWKEKRGIGSGQVKGGKICLRCLALQFM